MLLLLYGEVRVNPFTATATVWRGEGLTLLLLNHSYCMTRWGVNPFIAKSQLLYDEVGGGGWVRWTRWGINPFTAKHDYSRL